MDAPSIAKINMTHSHRNPLMTVDIIDDARRADISPPDNLPRPIAFDHENIVRDYRRYASEAARKLSLIHI